MLLQVLERKNAIIAHQKKVNNVMAEAPSSYDSYEMQVMI